VLSVGRRPAYVEGHLKIIANCCSIVELHSGSERIYEHIF